MQWTLSFLLPLALLAPAWTLSCFECDRATCRVPTCTTGLVKDVCDCCDVCAKAKGETCGGPWDRYGRCDQGLTCYKRRRPTDQSSDIFSRRGVCRRLRG